MIVQIPAFTQDLKKKLSPEEYRDFFADYYKDEKFIKVMPFGFEAEEGNALFSDACAGWDGMRVDRYRPKWMACREGGQPDWLGIWEVQRNHNCIRITFGL